MKTPTVSLCSTCRAPIWWTKTVAGKNLCVDEEPVENGNLVLEVNRATGGIKAMPFDETIHAARNRYQPHFATCPDAEQHRRR